MGRTVLELAGVTKTFGGVRALKGITFDLKAGEVHALVGENGAGKSTLIRVITGAHAPDSGSISIQGQHHDQLDPAQARQLGIAAIYQQPALFPDLSVSENIAIGLEPPSGWRRIDWPGRRERAARLLDRIGAAIDPDAEVRDLSMPEQQLVEIARSLGAEARILILDEPTASLSDREVDRLFRVIGELKAQGVGLLYISHRLEELPRIADRVSALRDGSMVGTRAIADVDRPTLIRMMVGRDLASVFPKKPLEAGPVALRVEGLTCRESGVRNVTFEVRRGEMLGLAGLIGSGRTELARVLFGLTPADSGRIWVDGAEVAIGSPAAAIKAGLAYVPEDRRHHGVIPEMSVAANSTLASLGRVGTLGWLRSGRERAVASSLVERFGVKTATVDAPVETLSGGNQQKVALGRWLETKPRVLILDEPTQGVDVGSKAEIHRIMNELAAEGMAIVMISSELPEILGMSDRVAVVYAGTIVATLDRAEATAEAVMTWALGHGAESSDRPFVAPERGRDMIGRFRRELSIVAAYAVILLVLAVRAPGFFQAENGRALVVALAPAALAAMGMTLVILCRQIDISIGSQASLCAVAAGLLAKAGWPMPAVLAATVALGAALGGSTAAWSQVGRCRQSW